MKKAILVKRARWNIAMNNEIQTRGRNDHSSEKYSDFNFVHCWKHFFKEYPVVWFRMRISDQLKKQGRYHWYSCVRESILYCISFWNIFIWLFFKFRLRNFWIISSPWRWFWGRVQVPFGLPQENRADDHSAVDNHICEPWHIICLQEGVGFANHATLHHRFHVVTVHHCALLLIKDTFERDVTTNSIMVPARKMCRMGSWGHSRERPIQAACWRWLPPLFNPERPRQQ